MDNDKRFIKIFGFVSLSIFMIIILGMVGCPQYRVYSQRLEGKALLANAQSSKEIAVAEARAKMDSAKMLADAEVIRAEGVAKANKIIGDSLKDNEGYLRYLWIQNIENTKNSVYYIPTETNLPIPEAGKRK